MQREAMRWSQRRARRLYAPTISILDQALQVENLFPSGPFKLKTPADPEVAARFGSVDHFFRMYPYTYGFHPSMLERPSPEQPQPQQPLSPIKPREQQKKPQKEALSMTTLLELMSGTKPPKRKASDPAPGPAPGQFKRRRLVQQGENKENGKQGAAAVEKNPRIALPKILGDKNGPHAQTDAVDSQSSKEKSAAASARSREQRPPSEQEVSSGCFIKYESGPQEEIPFVNFTDDQEQGPHPKEAVSNTPSLPAATKVSSSSKPSSSKPTSRKQEPKKQQPKPRKAPPQKKEKKDKTNLDRLKNIQRNLKNARR